MNYYEELGLTSEATADDIRRAYRTLTKLMHPDAQTDDSVRRLAEMQMRRLNTIVSTLTDEEKRKRYDRELKFGATPASEYVLDMTEDERPPLWSVVLFKVWRALPWWVWSTAGALILTSAAVYFWAGNVGSSFGNSSMAYVPAVETPAPKTSSPPAGGEPKPAGSEPKNDESAPNNLSQLTERLREALDSPKPLPEQPPKEVLEEKPRSKAAEIVSPRRDSVKAQDGKPSRNQRGQPQGSAQPQTASPVVEVATDHPQTPATEVPKSPPPPVEARATASNTAAALPAALQPQSGSQKATSAMEGDWVYSPDTPEPKKAGLFPPAFIELKIYRSSGEWRGVYHARYQVEDRPVDPDVNFLLSGTDADAKKFNWESPNGSKGTLRIKPVNDSTIKIEWETMVYSKQHVLTSGMATLSKR